jgi:hypothetical protein
MRPDYVRQVLTRIYKKLGVDGGRSAIRMLIEGGYLKGYAFTPKTKTDAD